MGYSLVFLILLIGEEQCGRGDPRWKEDWRIEVIGENPDGSGEEVEVGDGRGDGIMRVYVASPHGHLYEWSYVNEEWKCTEVHNYRSTIVACGKPTGKMKVYSGYHFGSGILGECEFVNNGWQVSNIMTLNIHSIRMGNAREGDTIRMYVGGGSGLYEFTYREGQWDYFPIQTGFTCAHMWLGKVRGDKTRIYAPNKFGKLYEFEWLGSDYKGEILPIDLSYLTAVVVGEGRNDGVERIYVAVRGGHLYEVSYTQDEWEVVDMTPTGPSASRYSLRVAKTQADKKFRVYAATQNYGLYEYTWNGSKYEGQQLLDATTGATACIGIGEGRNDDTVRIYATTFTNGKIYELTNPTPFVKIEEEERKWGSLRIFPNPVVGGGGEVVFKIGKNEVKQVKIYNLLGEEVKTVVTNSRGEAIWNLRDNYGERVGCGIYFCKVGGVGNVGKLLIF